MQPTRCADCSSCQATADRLQRVSARRGTLKFKLISIGVNAAPGADVLHFAEQDASRIAEVFTSDLGPVARGAEKLLLGARANRATLTTALLECLLDRPDILMVFFSGHGNREGIALSDGLFQYQSLAAMVSLIAAPRSLQVLDVCHAASYGSYVSEARVKVAGALDESWIHVLRRATPGNRLMFSTGADRLSGEGGSIQGGHFTEAFLSALRREGGTLPPGMNSFVSDASAFELARRVMRSEFRLTQMPEARGLRGDFPLVKSQVDEPVGGAVFLRSEIVPRGVALQFSVFQRRGVPTVLRYTVINAMQELVVEGEIPFTPDSDVYSGSIPLTYEMLTRSEYCRAQWQHMGRIHYTWNIDVADQEHGHVLDDARVRGYLG